MQEIGCLYHWPEVQFLGNIHTVVVIAGGTIWLLFGTFLILQLTTLPAALYRTAMSLLAAELVALLVHSYGGPTVAAVGRSVATIDVPLLSVALVAVAMMRAVSSQRRKTTR